MRTRATIECRLSPLPEVVSDRPALPMSDNIMDCSRKGRIGNKTHPERLPRGDRHGTHTKPHRIHCGTIVNTAKLDEETAQLIAALRGIVSQRTLARMFSVGYSTIGRAQRGESWSRAIQRRAAVEALRKGGA